MTKNLVIIALTLLLSITTGFGVVAWKMNNELARERNELLETQELRAVIFKAACDHGRQLEARLKSLLKICREQGIDVALAIPEGIYVEAPPAMTEEEFEAFKNELRRRKEEAERQFEREQEQPQT